MAFITLIEWVKVDLVDRDKFIPKQVALSTNHIQLIQDFPDYALVRLVDGFCIKTVERREDILSLIHASN